MNTIEDVKSIILSPQLLELNKNLLAEVDELKKENAKLKSELELYRKLNRTDSHDSSNADLDDY